MIETLIYTGVLLALVTAYILTGRGLQTSGSDAKYFLWTALWLIVQVGAIVAVWQADPAPAIIGFVIVGIVVWLVIHLVATFATAYTRYSN